jgi:ATP/maltotriose-dependent transcriptional regulator MalT
VDRLGNLSYDVRALAFLGGAVASLESVELFDAIETAARKMLASIQDADRVWTRSVVDTCLALVAVYRSDATLARAQYDRVKPGAGKFDPWVLLSYDRVLGGLAATAGDIKTAETHFDDALAFADESGCIREAVWARIEYAEMLLDRDEPGDTEKATRLQDEALAITQELGMRPLTERILARREILGA